MRKDKMVFASLLAVLALLPVVIIAVAIKLGVFGTISPEEIEATKAACANLTPPSSFKKIRDFEMVKSNSAIFSSSYLSNAEPEMVEDYFSALLTAKGWELDSRENSATVTLGFRKNQTLINIEYPSLNFISDRQYGISCSYDLP